MKTVTPFVFRAAVLIVVTLGSDAMSVGPPPAVPGALMVAPGDRQISVSWQPSARAQVYHVKRGSSGVGPFVSVATNLTATAWIDEGLTNGRTYHYIVTAANAFGESTNAPSLSAQPNPPVLDWLAGGATVERLATGFQFTEGPVWNAAEGGFLIFSDINGNRLYRWTPASGATIFRQPSNRANGNTLDAQGRLVTCEQITRAVTRTELDGTVTTLVDIYNGKPLNEPNDVVVKSDGTIWFTDPTYGNPLSQPGQYVYRFDPDQAALSLTLVARDTSSPNGIAFAPDEKRLYVADNRNNVVRAYEVLADNSLTNSRVFATITGPDGIRIDSAGRVFCSSADGIRIFGVGGNLLGRLIVPEQPSNLGFGGTNQEMLFITARTALYGITRRPDLVVTAIRRMPSNPVAGQAVRLFAVVKNQGTGATPEGVPIQVAFTVGTSTNSLWSDGYHQSLAPNASVVLEANGGFAGPDWISIAGSQSIRATVDSVGRIAESVEGNNASTPSTLLVGTAPLDNDGDGASDPEEAVAGTDPSSSESVFRLVKAELLGTRDLVLTWTSLPGKSYQVSGKGSLAEREWLDLGPIIPATAAITAWTNRITDLPWDLLYRVRIVP